MRKLHPSRREVLIESAAIVVGVSATPLRAAPTTTTRAPATRNVLMCIDHRSFNVVRLNSAKMIATMTKREITFGSLHPDSSK